jgi:lipoyl(octanoyl) transferase
MLVLPGGDRLQGAPGVWVGDAKVAAVGVAVRKWHTLHGVAINVAPNMQDFTRIIPCGLVGKRVASISGLVGPEVQPSVSMEAVKGLFRGHFEAVFNVELQPTKFPTLALKAAP